MLSTASQRQHFVVTTICEPSRQSASESEEEKENRRVCEVCCQSCVIYRVCCQTPAAEPKCQVERDPYQFLCVERERKKRENAKGDNFLKALFYTSVAFQFFPC